MNVAASLCGRLATCLVVLFAAYDAHSATPDLQSMPTDATQITQSLHDKLGKFDIEADKMEFNAAGDVEAEGNVEILQGERVIRAPAIRYRAADSTVSVPGVVELEDPQLRLSGEGAHVGSQGDAEFTRTEFELRARDGHGSADRLRVDRGGELDLHGVRYTTCPNPNPDWELKVGQLRIDAQAREGSASNARLEVRGIPVFYTPYISFPVGDARKTGLLFPNGGNSSRSGTALSVPWYWNIAPNYDATFTPTWYSNRGIDLGAEFRFLTVRHRGTLKGNYLPDDRTPPSDSGAPNDAQAHDRSLIALQTQSDFTEHLRVTTHATRVSDNSYFEDFGGAELSSTIVLPQTLHLQYRTDNWLLEARAHDYQVIDKQADPQIPAADRPYTMLPELGAHGYFPNRLWGLTAALDAQFAAFRRDNDNVPAGEQDYNGQRLDIKPELRWPLRSASAYLEPAIAWRYTTYRLSEERTPIADRSPSRSLPIFSIDGGMVFERSSGGGERLQTLEPRILYLYIPYREQGSLPIFDTARPDLNLIQLFRTNRYVGADRVGDTNQIAYGVTSRLLNAASGQQYLAATLGQIVRYAVPRVTLPDETPGIYERSDIIGELALTAYRHWTAQAGLQWNPNQRRAERAEFSFQYRPEIGSVINVGYRYRHADSSTSVYEGLKQTYGSIAWPVASNFSAYARVVYSLQDDVAIEQFAGLEYRSCCWNMRLLAGRSIATREGNFDTWVRWQFELKGLSSVGNADTFLEQSIPGYSSARFDVNSTPTVPR